MHIGFQKGTRDPYTIEPEHLKTHGVCVGMTGSGKTGLCIALLEELALKRIPMVLIDPKGDLGNIMLPPRSPEQMALLISPEESRAAGQADHAAYAAARYAEWQKAREQDQIPQEHIDRLATEVLFRIYTPGGGAGMGLSIMSALRAPVSGIEPDVGQSTGQRAEIVADTLLALLPKQQQTQHARSLVAALLMAGWQMLGDMTLPLLIDQIIDPPMAFMGGLDIETYYPRSKRMKLAQEFNAILSSPAWEAWLQGDPLDLGSLLWDNGNPTVTIISLGHLTDVQRQFFVALLMNQAVQWMRQQPGSINLRGLIYMDEVSGYFPPSANPPAKRAAMTLIKQGRAFGLGLMFASQNPVDLDYKILGNMGLWMVGKLSTERDKARLEEGLEGQLEVPTLGKREFLVRNIHGQTAVIRSRCTVSYLFGPLSQELIRALSGAMFGDRKGKGDVHAQRLERLRVAIDKQQQTVDMLQKEVDYAMGASVLTIGASILFGRRGAAMRALTRKPPKKAQALLEAKARLASLHAEYRSVYELMEREQ